MGNFQTKIHPHALPCFCVQILTNVCTVPAHRALSNVPVGNIPLLLLELLDIARQILKLVDEVKASVQEKLNRKKRWGGCLMRLLFGFGPFELFPPNRVVMHRHAMDISI